jgi:integrase
MQSKKTGRRQRIAVPKSLMEVLKWHVDTQLPPGAMRDSDLLFPSELGGFRTRSVLDKPFRAVAAAIGLKKKITPRGMRRSFQDLARAARVDDVVTRSIAGHATEEMQGALVDRRPAGAGAGPGAGA